MAIFKLNVNGQTKDVDALPDTPLLWVIRDNLQLSGTKFGCGMAQCGACTVHLDGTAIRSCSIPVSSIGERSVVTIEGISDGTTLHPVQKAWIETNVPQCGYCQTGQIMSAVALLAKNPTPTDQDINNAMSGNLCRCGTYERIKKAIHSAAKISAQ